MEIMIAFALNSEEAFERRHFGDADQYHIYELKDEAFQLISTEKNPFRTADESTAHGQKSKADQITRYLKDRGVSVLVSRQFGRNIKFIVSNFIPVVIRKESPEEVKKILLKHSRWVEEELDRQPERYKLFTVDSGILKSKIEQR